MRSRLGSPRAHLYAALCVVLVGIALFVVPTWPPHTVGGANSFLISVAGLAAIWAIVAVGTAMFVNLSGLPTLAHAGLWGAGAYGSAIAMTELDAGFWPSLLFAALVPALVALPVALISLRTTGVAFLIVTIAFTEFIVLVLTNASITEGSAGLAVSADPGSIGPIDLSELDGQYYLYLVFLAATLAVYRLVTRSSFGGRLRAIRDDERLARSLGINPLLHQLLLFELTAVIVGLAGALLVLQQGAITPDLFGTYQFLPIYLAMMLGGVATLAGPAVGAWIAQFLPIWIGSDDPNMSLLIYGLILVGAMVFLRQGILGTLTAWVGRDPRAEPSAPAAAAPAPAPAAAPAPAGAPPAGGGEPLLDATDIRRWFGANRALDGVDLTVKAGEIRGLIGPNGSGKTTLLNCISGFLPLTGGEIVYRGERIDGRSADRIARLGLVRTFQEPEVFPSFTVRETCELVARSHAGRSVNERMPDRPEAILASCGLGAASDLPVAVLPYGQLRLLGVAAALACRPRVLLVDEPAAGLAPADAAALRKLLLDARDYGVTVVIVDHDMAFLLPICDRVTVLDGGKKLTEAAPNEIARDPAVIAAYLGESFAERGAGGGLGVGGVL